jgi:hypothetical protein
VEVNLKIEKNQTTVTEKQRGGDCDQLEDVARVQNPVKIRVVFSANKFVIMAVIEIKKPKLNPKLVRKS